jgi:hypothetical protein
MGSWDVRTRCEFAGELTNDEFFLYLPRQPMRSDYAQSQ